jgi:hypothetical protein
MLQRGQICFELEQLALEKKRGRSGHERPKSREETPKEGYDNTSQARDVALHKLRVHCSIFKCNFCRAGIRG